MAPWSVHALIALLLAAVAPIPLRAQAAPRLRTADRVRLEEARRLARRIGDRVWPGLGGTGFDVLLVADSAEFLVGERTPREDFSRAGPGRVAGAEVWTRRRRFPPTLLATFPIGGVPTIVVGTAERTGKPSTAWVLTLLHEHFHQWQNSLPDYFGGVTRLDLARGDTTGQWMLDYPFPYDSIPVQEAMRGLAAALGRALDAGPVGRTAALREILARRDTLRALLSAADERYLEFQLWQEGVARYVEYAAGRAAARAGEPPDEFRRLPDYEPYAGVAERALAGLRRQLAELDLGQQRRVAFYPVGAATALLLDEAAPDWKETYRRRPFRLSELLASASR